MPVSRSCARGSVAALVLAAALWCGAIPATAVAASEPDRLPLRLSDLPAGFLVGDDSGCGLSLGGEGSPAALVELAQRHPQRACAMEFERSWAAAGAPRPPARVTSAAIAFERADGAVAGLEAAPELVAYTAGVPRRSLERRPAPEQLGDATVVFGTDDALVRGRARRPGVAMLWRTGSVLSLVFVAGRAETAGDAQALALARVQQARIAAPTPLSPEDNDDREVPLDNPRLGVPVFWLGEELDPPGALPPLALRESFGPIRRGGGPGWRAELDYEAGPAVAGATIGLWTPRAFARFERTRLGRLGRTGRCARSVRLDAPAGPAVIRAVHARPPRRCRRRAPDRFSAVVFADGAVISINIPHCLRCLGPAGAPRGPYDTRTGVEALVEAIRPRR